MRAFARVRSLTNEEYLALKKMERSRKLAAGKVKRAQVVLLSNQGYTRAEVCARGGGVRPHKASHKRHMCCSVWRTLAL